MPGGDDLDVRLRAAMFAHLSRVTAAHPDGAPSDVINSFTFDGSPMRLLVQPGIRKPAQLDAAPAAHEFAVDLGEYSDQDERDGDTALERRYTRRLTLHRLHQVLFRPKVLRAYDCRCALCRLRHTPLLDAAHILPDRHPHGD